MRTMTREYGSAPDKTTLRRWLVEGLTQQQAADRWTEETEQPCSRTAVAMAIARYGLTSTYSKPRYTETLPWRVKTEHLKHYDARMLRLLGRRSAGGRLGEVEHKELASWLRRLEELGAVVAYYPALPDGFRWVPREIGDGGGVIRRPA